MLSPQSNIPLYISRRAIKRYRDAYTVANSIDAQGQNIKSLALVAAILVGIAALIIAMAAGKVASDLALGAVVLGAVAAGVVWSIMHGFGVRVAAEGQHLLAALDVAVHTSPFLSDDERAEAIGLAVMVAENRERK